MSSRIGQPMDLSAKVLNPCRFDRLNASEYDPFRVTLASGY